METQSLTEAELYTFVERLDGFVAQLAPPERRFVTTILLYASTNRSHDTRYPAGHPDSDLHARLTRAIWEWIRDEETDIAANPLPLPSLSPETVQKGLTL
jgi:hypothetical protein